MDSAVNININLSSININGLNTEKKQRLLHQFMTQLKIDILLVQENNVCEDGKVKYLEKYYKILMNKSINFKGGTCILIKSNIDCEIERVEMSADSRVISAICKMQDRKIHLLNIYAPAGEKATREEFFENEIPYYIRHNTSNTFIGGDFNSVISSNDVSSSNTNSISKTLLKLLRDARLIDAWWVHNNHQEYTYVRQNYGSRIDRFYCNNRNNIVKSNVIHCSFSDHSAISIKININ